MRPAARVGDMHSCPMCDGPKPHVGGPIMPAGVPTVLIEGLPAAVVGTPCACAGPPDMIVQGSPTVLVGGKPLARMGDMTAHGGVIIGGAATVLIGDSAVTTAGGTFRTAQAATMSNARKAGSPLTPMGCEHKPAPAGEGAQSEESATKSLEIELKDDDGLPAAGVSYRVTTADGAVLEGVLDTNGYARIAGLDSDDCEVTFPELDAGAWSPA